MNTVSPLDLPLPLYQPGTQAKVAAVLDEAIETAFVMAYDAKRFAAEFGARLLTVARVDEQKTRYIVPDAKALDTLADRIASLAVSKQAARKSMETVLTFDDQAKAQLTTDIIEMRKQSLEKVESVPA